jgi:LTR polyprotein gag-polypeptide-like protein
MSGYEGKIPIFDGSNYAFWKRKMQMHLIAIDLDVWEVVNAGYRIEDPVIPNINDKRNIQNNARAATAIFMGLQEHDFNRVSTMDSAKEIWDTLEQIYEGSDTLKKSKRGLLESKLERFEYEHGEDINSLFSRLTIITNQLKALGSNRVDDEDVVKKFLSVLPKPYRTLVLMLKEKDGFDQMKPTEVLGRILTHEMEIKQESKHTSTIVKKNIALKISSSTPQHDSNSEDDPDEDMSSGEENELNLLTRNFRKFYRRKK